MAHRADTPISQRLLTNLHGILDSTNLSVVDIANMMGADKRNLRQIAYGRLQKLHFSGFVERLELTLADIGDWITENGHHGVTHYVRNSHRKYSLQATSKKNVKRFSTGAHFTGKRIATKKKPAPSKQNRQPIIATAVKDYLAQAKVQNAQMDTLIQESKTRLEKADRFNKIMNRFLILDAVLLALFLVIMIVQSILS